MNYCIFPRHIRADSRSLSWSFKLQKYGKPPEHRRHNFIHNFSSSAKGFSNRILDTEIHARRSIGTIVLSHIDRSIEKLRDPEPGQTVLVPPRSVVRHYYKTNWHDLSIGDLCVTIPAASTHLYSAFSHLLIKRKRTASLNNKECVCHKLYNIRNDK